MTFLYNHNSIKINNVIFVNIYNKLNLLKEDFILDLNFQSEIFVELYALNRQKVNKKNYKEVFIK